MSATPVILFYLLSLPMPAVHSAASPAGRTEAALRGEDQAAQVAPGRLVFATCVHSAAQARKAAVLIRSIRRFSGPYSASPVYVAVDGGEKLPCAELAAAGAILLPLEMEEPARNCPFAHKVFASAQVERRIAASADTMVWLDAETLILAPPRALDLRAGCAVAMRPVFLVNNVGIPPDRPPDIFSSGIYA